LKTIKKARFRENKFFVARVAALGKIISRLPAGMCGAGIARARERERDTATAQFKFKTSDRRQGVRGSGTESRNPAGLLKILHTLLPHLLFLTIHLFIGGHR
jgi:hypothetical protein